MHFKGRERGEQSGNKSIFASLFGNNWPNGQCGEGEGREGKGGERREIEGGKPIGWLGEIVWGGGMGRAKSLRTSLSLTCPNKKRKEKS